MVFSGTKELRESHCILIILINDDLSVHWPLLGNPLLTFKSKTCLLQFEFSLFDCKLTFTSIAQSCSQQIEVGSSAATSCNINWLVQLSGVSESFHCTPCLCWLHLRSLIAGFSHKGPAVGSPPSTESSSLCCTSLSDSLSSSCSPCSRSCSILGVTEIKADGH